MTATLETTYNGAYRRRPFRPPIKFRQPPSMELCIRFNYTLPMLPPRQFPLQPCGPKRILEIERAPGIGLGTKDINTEKYLDPKPIVRSHRPNELFEVLQKSRPKSGENKRLLRTLTRELVERMPAQERKDIVNALTNTLKFTTTTQQAAREAAAPCTEVPPPENTLEENADLVKYRPRRYEAETADWQIVGNDWDKVQSRPPIHHSLYDDPAKDDDQAKPDDTQKGNEKQGLCPDVTERIKDLVKTDDLNSPYVRKCPGYAGFVPRAPIECSMEKKKTETMVSCMKASYRPLTSEYTTAVNAHKAPLSKTVTLTHPFNAFNKVQKRLKFTYYI